MSGPAPDRQPAGAPAGQSGVVLDLTHEGAGVVRAGKTVFVAGALPGERIRYRVVRRHRQFDEAQLLEVIEPSAQRVTPRCAHVDRCGGCALQHLEPAAQLEAKQRELALALERIARATPTAWLEPVSGPQWNYRRRARLGVKYVRAKERVLVGFRERLAPYVADVTRCEVLVEPVHALLTPLAELVGHLSIRTRLPQIEVAAGDRTLALVFRVLDPPDDADRARFAAFAREHGVQVWLQTGGIETVAPLEPDPAPLTYDLAAFGLTLRFAPTDFVQVNAAVNAALVERAVGLLDPDRNARVLDLFCGLGNFTLPLATRAGEVTGVEGDAGLIERARANAAANGLGNLRFHVGDLAVEPAADAAWLRGPPTHVLLDPPRVGARAVLGAIARCAPRRIVYVSCHPGSLARDVGILVHELGFTLSRAGVVDMFPHTTHVESIAVLDQDRGGRA